MKRSNAFTLVEMLVVMGIIAVLASIALPVVIRALGAGEKTRIAATLQTLSVALEAYNADFGMYPPVIDYFNDDANNDFDKTGPYPPSNPAPDVNNGAYALITSLMGIGNSGEDGNEGPGFRTRKFRDQWTGKVYVPYLTPGAIPMTPKPENKVSSRAFLIKSTGRPILYYNVNRTRTNLTLAGSFFADNATYTSPTPFINYRDNIFAVATGSGGETVSNAIDRLRYFVGDTTGSGTVAAPYGDGMITGTEKSKVRGGYILWTSGLDRGYGPEFANTDTLAKKKKAMLNCDDITLGIDQ